MAIKGSQTVKNILITWIDTVKEVNQKYKKPRIKMTLGVKIALITLRIYLIILIGLMFYKFFMTVYGH